MSFTAGIKQDLMRVSEVVNRKADTLNLQNSSLGFHLYVRMTRKFPSHLSYKLDLLAVFYIAPTPKMFRRMQ